MAPRHVVVDGSNIATEGRSMPSLAQLDQAVREFLIENPTDVVTVVVDASFGHRIDPSELDLFEGAEEAGELVSPPAGAIGRGDAFLLRIADKTGATVLSNDSFQEFHGDYEWLFERGRLIGGKPVPGVGWIFTPRTPVRGPRSREAVQEAKRKMRGEPDSTMSGLDLAAERARGKGKGKKTVERAIAVALEEVVAPKGKPRRRSGGSPPAEPVNDPLAFITFIAAHPLGTEVTATVESFASHGAFVEVEGARCYVPLSAMGDPPPKSAREVFTKGEVATFVIQALDPQRRGVELALPGFAKVAGAPTAETVEAEIESRSDQAETEADVVSGEAEAAQPALPLPRPAPAKRSRKKAGPAVAEPLPAEPEPAPAPVKKARGRRAATPAPAPEPSEAAEPVGGTVTSRKRTPAKKALAVPAAAGDKAPARKRTVAKKVPVPVAPEAAEAAEAAVSAMEPRADAVPPVPAPPGGRAPRKRAPAKKAIGQKGAQQEDAARDRVAARQARSEVATSEDESGLAFRTAGRKRTPPTKTSAGGGRPRATTPAVPAGPEPVKRSRAKKAGPASVEPEPATVAAAEPPKVPRARRAPAAKKSAAPPEIAAPSAAAAKPTRRRAGRVPPGDDT